MGPKDESDNLGNDWDLIPLLVPFYLRFMIKLIPIIIHKLMNNFKTVNIYKRNKFNNSKIDSNNFYWCEQKCPKTVQGYKYNNYS